MWCSKMRQDKLLFYTFRFYLNNKKNNRIIKLTLFSFYNNTNNKRINRFKNLENYFFFINNFIKTEIVFINNNFIYLICTYSFSFSKHFLLQHHQLRVLSDNIRQIKTKSKNQKTRKKPKSYQIKIIQKLLACALWIK